MLIYTALPFSLSIKSSSLCFLCPHWCLPLLLTQIPIHLFPSNHCFHPYSLVLCFFGTSCHRITNTNLLFATMTFLCSYFCSVNNICSFTMITFSILMHSPLLFFHTAPKTHSSFGISFFFLSQSLSMLFTMEGSFLGWLITTPLLSNAHPCPLGEFPQTHWVSLHIVPIPPWLCSHNTTCQFWQMLPFATSTSLSDFPALSKCLLFLWFSPFPPLFRNNFITSPFDQQAASGFYLAHFNMAHSFSYTFPFL